MRLTKLAVAALAATLSRRGRCWPTWCFQALQLPDWSLCARTVFPMRMDMLDYFALC